MGWGRWRLSATVNYSPAVYTVPFSLGILTVGGGIWTWTPYDDDDDDDDDETHPTALSPG